MTSGTSQKYLLIQEYFSMPHDNDKLLREEVRGVFVLGIIGTLLALRGVDLVFLDISLATLSNWLIGFWGIYVVLMVVGVSEDIISSSVANLCEFFAKIYFIAGLAILMTLPILNITYYFLQAAHFDTSISLWAVFFISFFLFVLVLIRRDGSNSVQQLEQPKTPSP